MKSALHVQESILIHATIERCFDLSTRIEVVQQTLGFTPIPAIGAVTMGERVHWRGRLLGFTHDHHSLITAFDPPNFFQDAQERGRFASFHHDHRFKTVDGGTLLLDEVVFSLPWWMGGSFSARFVMAPHIRRLVRRRFALLKQMLETSSA